MPAYYALPLWVQAVVLTLQFLSFCIGLCLLPRVMTQRPVTPKLFVPLATLLSAAMLTVYSSGVRVEKKQMPLPAVTAWFSERTVLWPVLALLLVLGYFGYVLWQMVALQNSRITRASIREGVNKLPAGLCFYYENGRCILTNHRMNALCHAIVGRDLQNAALFWSFLESGEQGVSKRYRPAVTRLESGDTPTFRLADGSVWAFAREKAEGVFQLSAVEVTQVQQITDELTVKKQELDRINRRLHQYGESVDELTRAKERLETKANIHRELGQALLINRKYVIGSVVKEAPFDAWDTIVATLRCENTVSEKDPLAMFMYAADRAGIQVNILGELPARAEVKNMFIMAAVEALLNAVRHAEATVLTIAFSCDAMSYTVRFTNNGKQPVTAIVEGGGLTSLRRRAKALGGDMQVEIAPEFALSISALREGGDAPCTA